MFFAASLVAFGCSSSDAPEPTGGAKSSSVIGTEGGQVETDDGFSITIPEGALSEDVTITVEKLEQAPDFVSGPVYKVGPSGLNFAQPVKVRVPVDAIDLGFATQRLLTVFTAPDDSEEYEMLATITDSGADFVEAETMHFSKFGGGSLTPVVLSSSEKFPLGMSFDGTDVYWANGGNSDNQLTHGNQGYIVKAPAGGGAVSLVSAAQEDPVDVATDATNIYWITGGRGVDDPLGGVDSTVMKMAKSGGAPVQLYAGGYPGAMEVDATNVYWTDRDSGEILMVPIAGGSHTVLATAQGHDLNYIALDTDSVYWTTGVGGTGGANAGKISKVAKAGGAVTDLATGQADPAGVAVWKSKVYWGNEGDGWLRAVGNNGGTVSDLGQGSKLAGLAVIDDQFVVGDNGTGNVYTGAINMGSTTVIASGQALPKYVDAAGGKVVWSTQGANAYEGTINIITMP